MENLVFEIADVTNLQYKNNSFDVVIISNTLHILQNPEKVLDEIKRVLKVDGILISPTFTHGKMKPRKKLLAAIMQKITGFKAVNAWSKEEFIKFLENNSYRIIRVKSLKASFPLTYVECK